VHLILNCCKQTDETNECDLTKCTLDCKVMANFFRYLTYLLCIVAAECKYGILLFHGVN